jgi:hypothetical protein
MTNTEQNDDWTAPLRELIASLRRLETRFKNAEQTIRQYRPDEQIGDFPSSPDDIEKIGSGELGVREVFCRLAVRVIEQRAEELLAEAEEAERVRADTLRRQNMSPLEAKVERLERALAYQGSEIAKLKGVQHGQLPALPHVSRSEVPQFLGMPSGMGRHGAMGPAGSGGGVRKLGTSSPSAPDTAGDGFTRRIHPPGRDRRIGEAVIHTAAASHRSAPRLLRCTQGGD